MFKSDGKRIIKGSDTGEAIPYQLQLLISSKAYKKDFHFCGATLVTRKYATSALHCFTGLNVIFAQIGAKFTFDLVTVVAGKYHKSTSSSRYVQVSKATGEKCKPDLNLKSWIRFLGF